MRIYFSRYRYLLSLTGLLILLLSACHTAYRPQAMQYKNYRIEPARPADSSLIVFLQPYRDSVNKSMNTVVGTAPVALDKQQPEGTLGNFMADALLVMARVKYNTKVDGAVVNYGGIRLNQLAAGPVTRGKVFELMPFDNLLILQKLKGDVLQQFLDLTAARGGWPISGITYQIKDKKAVNVKVGGQPLDPSSEYVLANSDYVANGGDNADMLRAIPQITNGYLMRDAIFDYINTLKVSGKNISATIENRVSNAQ